MDQGYGAFFPYAVRSPDGAPRVPPGPGPEADTVALDEGRPTTGPVRPGLTPPERAVASVLVFTDTERRRTYSVQLLDRVTLGREESLNDIAVRDQRISARHCEVFREGGRLMVRDVGSTNGTVLVSRGVRYPVDRWKGLEIQTGDMLEIGLTRLELSGV